MGAESQDNLFALDGNRGGFGRANELMLIRRGDDCVTTLGKGMAGREWGLGA